MHDAKQSSLSKIEVGDRILAVPGSAPGTFGYGRPKDQTAQFQAVKAKSFVPDEWSGKQWTVTLTDGRTSEHPRYGTTHVYVALAEADPYTPDADVQALAEAITADPRIPGGATAVKIPTLTRVETVADLGATGDQRLVTDLSSGVTVVRDWTGGDYRGTTKHGINVHITDNGTVLVIDDDGTERPPTVTRDDRPRQLSDAEADAREIPEVPETDDCGNCKGFGVVRKYGSQAGKRYRTVAGSIAATEKGNSTPCPVCEGTGGLRKAA